MTSASKTTPASRAALALLTTIAATLAACGGSADEEVGTLAASDRKVALAASQAPTANTPTQTLKVGTTIAGFPHKIDIYQPAGATRAIVFLHGHGGKSWYLAYDLKLNKAARTPVTKNIDWEWLTRNGVIAVFPQGQAKPGTTLGTWSNHVFDSGQDDVAFLMALARQLRNTYGITDVTLAGHSSGGVMTGRMWCEATSTFTRYTSIAGPMVTAEYPMPGHNCAPPALAPYDMVVGGSDTKLPMFTTGLVSPTPEQVAAGLTDSILVSEWFRHQGRALSACGEQPSLGSATPGPNWSQCGGTVRYRVVAGADHPIPSIEMYLGQRMVDRIAAFAR